MESVRKALLVLESVAALQPVGVAEISRHLDLPKSSVQRSLVTLNENGWIRHSGSEITRWEITSKAVQLGQRFRASGDLRESVLPVMAKLREAVDETVHLMVPDGGNMVLIERILTQRPLRVEIPIGRSMAMHMISNGKAYLAHLGSEAVDEYVAHGLERSTDRTITDPGALREELAAVRERGYAVNRGEWRTDICAIASAILTAEGKPVGSVSISTPPERMPAGDEERLGELVVDATHTIRGGLVGVGGA